jgi:hypothetical protein
MTTTTTTPAQVAPTGGNCLAVCGDSTGVAADCPTDIIALLTKVQFLCRGFADGAKVRNSSNHDNAETLWFEYSYTLGAVAGSNQRTVFHSSRKSSISLPRTLPASESLAIELRITGLAGLSTQRSLELNVTVPPQAAVAKEIGSFGNSSSKSGELIASGDVNDALDLLSAVSTTIANAAVEQVERSHPTMGITVPDTPLQDMSDAEKDELKESAKEQTLMLLPPDSPMGSGVDRVELATGSDEVRRHRRASSPDVVVTLVFAYTVDVTAVEMMTATVNDAIEAGDIAIPVTVGGVTSVRQIDTPAEQKTKVVKQSAVETPTAATDAMMGAMASVILRAGDQNETTLTTEQADAAFETVAAISTASAASSSGSSETDREDTPKMSVDAVDNVVQIFKALETTGVVSEKAIDNIGAVASLVIVSSIRPASPSQTTNAMDDNGVTNGGPHRSNDPKERSGTTSGVSEPERAPQLSPEEKARQKEVLNSVTKSIDALTVQMAQNQDANSTTLIESSSGGLFILAGKGDILCDKYETSGAMPTLRSGNVTFEVDPAWLQCGAESRRRRRNGAPSPIFSSTGFTQNPYDAFTDNSPTSSVSALTLYNPDGSELKTEGQEQCTSILIPLQVLTDGMTSDIELNKSSPFVGSFFRTRTQANETMQIVIEPFVATAAPDTPITISVFVVEGPVDVDNFDLANVTAVALVNRTLRATRLHPGLTSYTADGAEHVIQIIPERAASYSCTDTNAEVDMSEFGRGLNASETSREYSIIVVTDVEFAPETNVSGIRAAMQVFHAACSYLEGSSEVWMDTGCSVSPLTTPALLQCDCNHLTTFGGGGSSAGVKPNLVKIRMISASDIGNNPVVFVPMVLLWVCFSYLVYKAKKLDKIGATVVGPVYLESNSVEHMGLLKVSVHTGVRPRAGLGPSGRVFVRLFGTRGGTADVELTHPWRPLFLRNATDVFVVSTPLEIGIVKSITIRHDSDGFGDNARWYLGHVEVVNLRMGGTTKRTFWVDNWLALDAGLYSREATVAGEEQKQANSKAHVFQSRVTHGLADVHTVASVFLCPPNANPRRSERTMILMLFFSVTVFCNAFFFRGASEESEQSITDTLIIAAMTCGIVMIPTTVVMQIFRRARDPVPPSSNEDPALLALKPSRKKKARRKKSEGKYAVPKAGVVLVEPVGPAVSAQTHHHSMAYVEKLLIDASEDEGQDGVADDEATLRWMAEHPADRPPAAETKKSTVCCFTRKTKPHRKKSERRSSTTLPPWTRYLAWSISLAVAGFACYYVLLLSFAWGPETSTQWLTSVVLSVFMSTFVADPLLIVTVSLLAAFIMKTMSGSQTTTKSAHREIVYGSTRAVQRLYDLKNKQRKAHVQSRKVHTSSLQAQLRFARLDMEMGVIFTNLLLYVAYFSLLVFVHTFSRSDGDFAVLSDTFGKVAQGPGGPLSGVSVRDGDSDFGGITNHEDFLDWATGASGSLYSRERYGGQSGLVGDAASSIGWNGAHLVGAARLRQLRVPLHSCRVPTAAVHTDMLTSDCQARWMQRTDEEKYYQPHDGRYISNGSATFYGEPVGSC